jgi:ABC-type Fe3+ transport system permease subunit
MTFSRILFLFTLSTVIKLMSEKKEQVKLFITGFAQVLLVAINTYQLAHEKWLGCAIVGFLISYVWTWNVKKIAFGSHTDRLLYAGGAMCGTVAGLALSLWFYK